MTEVLDLSPDQIIEGVRFREDLGDITDLAKSIAEFGIIQPIVVDPDYRLVAGGRRLNAARFLGLTTIPCVIRPDASDDLTLRKLELTENLKRKSFHWAEEARLHREIHRMETKTNVTKGKRWTLEDTGKLLEASRQQISKLISLADAMDTWPDLAELPTMEDAIREIRTRTDAALAAARAKKGKEEFDREYADLASGRPAGSTVRQGEGAPAPEAEGPTVRIDPAELGVHAPGDSAGGVPAPNTASPDCALTNLSVDIVQGIAERRLQTADAFVGMASLESDSFDLIHCDPPYGVDMHKIQDEGYEHVFDDSLDWYTTHLPQIASETYRLAKPGTWMIFWFGMKNYQITLDALRAAGWNVDPVPAVWAKPSGNSQRPNHKLGSRYETFFACGKGVPALGKPGSDNLFTFPHAKGKFHSTQKPVALISALLDTFTVGPGRVLDPFMGSGSCAVAATLSKHRYTGFELSPSMASQARQFFLDYLIHGRTDE